MLLPGFFPFANAAQGILLFAFLLFVVCGDALFDVALKLTAETHWQLGKFKRHLIVLILLSILLDNLDDSFALLGCQTVDLTDQVVPLFNSEGFLLRGHSRRTCLSHFLRIVS